MSPFRALFRQVVSRRPLALLKRSCSNHHFEVKSTFKEVEVPRIPIDELVFKNADKWGHKIAVECGITGRNYTYDQLRRYADNFSRILRKKFKIQNGDVVAIMMPNMPEYPIAIFGILKANGVTTPINPIYTEEEITRHLKDSGAKIIITLGAFTKSAKAAVSNTKKNIPILAVVTQPGESLEDGVINFMDLVKTETNLDEVIKRDVDGLALLPYSSGTTGLPKGVELTNLNLIANVMQCTSPEILLFDLAEGNHQDVTIALLPMFHIYGTESLFWFLTTGCKTITLPKFSPELYSQSIINHKPTALFIVPPIAIFLSLYPGLTAEHLKPIKAINSGAAPLGALDEQRLKDKAGRDLSVLQGYGLSEAPVVVLTALKRPKTPGSVGEPIPNTQVKVVALDDPSETPLGPNETGELYVKGPQVMRAYYNNPKATQDIFSNGWMKTGDMVYYNEKKQFFITDRIKELIKVKGFQVAPAELEEIIRDFDGVADACVIGVPHQFLGEVPRAYVVPKQGTTINTDKLSEYVNSKVASYKRIDGGVAVVESIPKNASGKLLRRQLKEQYMYENK